MNTKIIALALALCAGLWLSSAMAQSGLYVPSDKPIRNMEKALTNPPAFHLLLKYNANADTYSVDDLDLLDSTYRIAFDIDNPMYYTMSIEGYGNGDEHLTKERVDAVYRYFAKRSGANFLIRTARNKIHCSCNGDTVETLRFEVPVTTAVYDCADLPEARRLLNKSIRLDGCVLVTFKNNPDECVGSARGCFIPKADSTVRGYYASLVLSRGSVYAVDNTKDTCPDDLEIKIDDHLDYKTTVEKYNLIPHPKQMLVQAGYIVIQSNWARGIDSCRLAQKDSIYIRVPVTQEQMDAKLKFFAKVKGSKGGVEYKALPTRRVPGKGVLMLQATINVTQFDTIYLGKRIQDSELGKYFYSVDGPTEAAAFKAADKWWVAYRPAKGGTYELKKPLKSLFRIIPEQEEESPAERQKSDKKAPKGEEILED
ncbi:MAG: hypothetical protein J6W88_06825 [Bacteroidales bacterium]|nr:hypothetical protein [Bacteroidales bacterium]